MGSKAGIEKEIFSKQTDLNEEKMGKLNKPYGETKVTFFYY